MARIIEVLITGVGFIGGGALNMAAPSEAPPTAASLWATGVIGAAVGLAAMT